MALSLCLSRFLSLSLSVLSLSTHLSPALSLYPSLSLAYQKGREVDRIPARAAQREHRGISLPMAHSLSLSLSLPLSVCLFISLSFYPSLSSSLSLSLSLSYPKRREVDVIPARAAQREHRYSYQFKNNNFAET